MSLRFARRVQPALRQVIGALELADEPTNLANRPYAGISARSIQFAQTRSS
jgi:hypothetical protein